MYHFFWDTRYLNAPCKPQSQWLTIACWASFSPAILLPPFPPPPPPGGVGNELINWPAPRHYCQTPVQSPSFSFRLGVDNNNHHQSIAEESILEVLNLTHRLIPSSLLPSPTDINPIRLEGLCVFSYCS